MRLVFLISLFTLVSSFCSAISLQKSYELALENSETLSLAEIKALIEEDRTREVWGIAYPQISAKADFLARGDVKRFRHHERTKNAKVSLIMPLFAFGGTKNLINAQEKREEAAFVNIDRARQEVLYATHNAYFTLLEAQKIVKILEESMQTLHSQLRITQDFAEQGFIHENEKLAVEVELQILELDHVQAQNQISLAIAKLNRLIGCALDQPQVAEDILEETCYNQNLDQIIFEAKANHPTLRALYAQIESAHYSHKGEKAKLYPVIYGYTNYSTTDDYALPYVHGFDAGIGIQWSLYDGGTTLAKVKRLEKEACELEQRYIAEEKNIELHIRTAFMNVENAVNKIPLTLKEIELANRKLKISQDHFTEGLVTNAEVIDDGENCLKARFNYYRSLYQFHKAKADLIYAAGITIYKKECQNEN